MGIHNKYTRIKDMLMNVFETLFYKLETSSAIFRSLFATTFYGADGRTAQDVYANEER